MVWENYSDKQVHETRIKLGERVIFSEMGGWENYGRFIEVAKILRARYGPAVKDLVPTHSSGSVLWGDCNSAQARLELARERIFGVEVTRTNRWADYTEPNPKIYKSHQPVSINAKTNEMLVWPAGLEGMVFGRRLPDGKWIFGTEARPTDDELIADYEPVTDHDIGGAVLREAQAAFAESPLSRGPITLDW